MTVTDHLENVRAWWDEDGNIDPDAFEPADDAVATQPLDASAEPPRPSSKEQDFVHLHVHSEFSLLDGLSPVKRIVETAKRNGMRAVALTDHGNLYGAIDFYSYARSAGIKPIIGVEAYVSPRGMSDRVGNQDRNYFHLVLLANAARRTRQRPDRAERLLQRRAVTGDPRARPRPGARGCQLVSRCFRRGLLSRAAGPRQPGRPGRQRWSD